MRTTTKSRTYPNHPRCCSCLAYCKSATWIMTGSACPITIRSCLAKALMSGDSWYAPTKGQDGTNCESRYRWPRYSDCTSSAASLAAPDSENPHRVRFKGVKDGRRMRQLPVFLGCHLAFLFGGFCQSFRQNIFSFEFVSIGT